MRVRTLPLRNMWSRKRLSTDPQGHFLAKNTQKKGGPNGPPFKFGLATAP